MPAALRRLDAHWWTSFCFFVASVAISSSLILYRASVEEAHYRDLFGMVVQPPPEFRSPPSEAPSVQAPPASEKVFVIPPDRRALDI